MRFLHTADWHVGKKLGRISRMPEFEAMVDELVAIARDERVDAVLVAGDLWDRPLPPLDSIKLVVDALIRLADAAGRVVATPGNHDSADLMEVLARLLEPHGVSLVPRIRPPASGGVVEVPSKDGAERARVAALPFLHEAVVIADLMKKDERWFESENARSLLGAERYADKLKKLSAALCEGFEPGGIGILMAHYFVDGAEVGGGERKIHLGDQYAATAQAVPPGASYVALGHIHKSQAIPGSAAPARYAGSPLQLDFSERTHQKQAVVVDVARGTPAKVRLIDLSAGRKLIRVQDDLDALRARSGEFGNAYLDVRVQTSGPVFGLAEQVRQFLPNAVMVQAVYDRLPVEQILGSRPADGSISNSYAAYHAAQHGVEAGEALLDEVRMLEEEVMHAAT